MDFDEFFTVATGSAPYRYQQCLASAGLPTLLRAPTGAGKTAAAVLPWLWRRRYHPERPVRGATPRWLVMALPLRTLVEQAAERVAGWLANLDLATEVEVHAILGGEGRRASGWRRHPERDAVFVGSIDMLLSRALNRGYAMSRFAWPTDFGMFNNGCQWVFDEVQLMGPALPTSRQLQGLRDALGTVVPTRTMWMSATVEIEWLRTIDAPQVASVVDVTPESAEADLRRLLLAPRRVERLRSVDGFDPVALADAALAHHRGGTRTIVVLNTVHRAQALYGELSRRDPPAEVVLVHSRFRPPDRGRATGRALGEPGTDGTVVVATQALEAGVDLSSRTLITEAAPWASIVQRAGRCNRYREQPGARMLWTEPPDSAPYEHADVRATVAALERFEGQAVTGAQLARTRMAPADDVHPHLRRKDLLELFDTSADLSGHDVEVGRFIRDAEDIDVRIAWRDVTGGGLAPARLADPPPPTREELCPAPVGSVRTSLKGAGVPLLWRHDHLDGAWIRIADADQLRPGTVLIADVRFGRYSPEAGWDASGREPVEPVAPAPPDEVASPDEAVGSDPLSHLGEWVGLRDHLAHTEQAAAELLESLADGRLPADLQEAVRLAARYHDAGKAHEVFQDTMRRSAGDHERELVDAGGPWAKSSRWHRPRHRRAGAEVGFRHELAGALGLLSPPGESLLDGINERALVVYLVAAHHGRVRLGIRSLPEERSCPDGGERMMALGVCDGDELPPVDLPAGERLEATRLDLSPMTVGGDRSWSAMALRLRDRADLGVFRLGFLEALVILADWRASAREGGSGP